MGREREKRKKRNDMTVTNGDVAMNGVHEKPCTGVKVNKEVEDLLLWEDPIKSGSILGGATVAYLLFHCSGYTAMYIVCNLLLVGVVGTFVWSIMALVRSTRLEIPTLTCSPNVFGLTSALAPPWPRRSFSASRSSPSPSPSPRR